MNITASSEAGFKEKDMSGIKKNFDSKADVIQALAATAGASPDKLRKYAESKWDEATGTYYCNGKMFSKLSIFRSKNYFADQAAKYSAIGTQDAKELAQMYDLAYEAISELEKGSQKGGTDGN